MIKDFETYIAEGRMGRLIDAAKKDEIRKEDDCSFFGPGKEWMLYSENGNNLFHPDDVQSILDKMKPEGWRLADIDDFIDALADSEETRNDCNIRKKYINLSVSQFLVMNDNSNYEYESKDHIVKLTSQFGEIEFQRYPNTKTVFNPPTYTCKIFVMVNGVFGKAVYINEFGRCGITGKDVEKDKKAYIILIRNKK